MLPFLARVSFVLIVLAPLATGFAAEPSSRPLGRVKLLALVAGSTAPAKIAREIATEGISFHANDSYGAELRAAGASSMILKALDAAKVIDGANIEAGRSQQELEQHITAAAKLMRDKRYSEAGEELTAALKVSVLDPEIGFVMGEVLRQQERWPQAAAVYGEVLKQAPDFIDAHTKLSYIRYRLGDNEESLNEARTALAEYA